MKLTGRYRILIEGDAAKVKASPRDKHILEYLLARLVAGETVAEREFASWGITVLECDPDSDEFVRIPRMDD